MRCSHRRCSVPTNPAPGKSGGRSPRPSPPTAARAARHGSRRPSASTPRPPLPGCAGRAGWSPAPSPPPASPPEPPGSSPPGSSPPGSSPPGSSPPGSSPPGSSHWAQRPGLDDSEADGGHRDLVLLDGDPRAGGGEHARAALPEQQPDGLAAEVRRDPQPAPPDQQPARILVEVRVHPVQPRIGQLGPGPAQRDQLLVPGEQAEIRLAVGLL